MTDDLCLTRVHDKQNDDRLEKILVLQRYIRSYYVRRQFEEVRKEYLKTLTDIEGDIPNKSIEIPSIKKEKIPTERVDVPSKNVEPISVKTPDIVQKNIETVVLTKEELLSKREHIAMELLWIEQAIQSRKDYLRLRSRYK